MAQVVARRALQPAVAQVPGRAGPSWGFSGWRRAPSGGHGRTLTCAPTGNQGRLPDVERYLRAAARRFERLLDEAVSGRPAR